MVSVYFKPTNFCNVGCEHCYLSDEIKANKELMSDETIEKSAIFLRDMSRDLNQGKEEVTIIFHGGEPLMAPPEWYDKAFSILEKHIQKVNYSIQTSLMPDPSKHIDVFKKIGNGLVGVSVDFTSRTLDGSSDKYLSKLMKRINFLRQNNLRVALGLVPAKGDLGREKEIIDWFHKNELNRFRIERFNSWGFETDIEPTNEEHSDFLINMFDYCLENMKAGKPYINITTMACAVSGIIYQLGGDTYGGTCQTDMVTIDPNGDVYACPNRSSYEEAYSNVSDGWKIYRSNKRRKQWILKQTLFNYSSKCGDCEYVSWCKGCCPISNHESGGKDDDCAGFQKFLLHIQKKYDDPETKNLVNEFFERSSVGQMYLNWRRKQKELNRPQLEPKVVERVKGKKSSKINWGNWGDKK
jgi:radical SAM protein with 4Fe4S-binding SPASM domain